MQWLISYIVFVFCFFIFASALPKQNKTPWFLTALEGSNEVFTPLAKKAHSFYIVPKYEEYVAFLEALCRRGFGEPSEYSRTRYFTSESHPLSPEDVNLPFFLFFFFPPYVKVTANFSTFNAPCRSTALLTEETALLNVIQAIVNVKLLTVISFILLKPDMIRLINA